MSRKNDPRKLLLPPSMNPLQGGMQMRQVRLFTFDGYQFVYPDPVQDPISFGLAIQTLYLGKKARDGDTVAQELLKSMGLVVRHYHGPYYPQSGSYTDLPPLEQKVDPPQEAYVGPTDPKLIMGEG